MLLVFKLVVNRWSKGSERVQAKDFKTPGAMRSSYIIIPVALCGLRFALALITSGSVRYQSAACRN